MRPSLQRNKFHTLQDVLDRENTDTSLVDKNELTEEESSHTALFSSLLNNSGQFQILIGLKLVEFICTVWSQLSMMYSLEQMSWIVIFLLCVILKLW